MRNKNKFFVFLVIFLAVFIVGHLIAEVHECEDQGKCAGQCHCTGTLVTDDKCAFHCEEGGWCEPDHHGECDPIEG